MPTPQSWPEYLFVLAIGSAIPILWRFLSTHGWKFWTQQQTTRGKAEEADRQHDRDIEDASLAALASNSVAASSQVIISNQKLIDYLIGDNKNDIGEVNRALGKVGERLGMLQGVLVRLEASSTLRTIDWSRVQEVVSDIDEWMRRIDDRLEMIETILSKREHEED